MSENIRTEFRKVMNEGGPRKAYDLALKYLKKNPDRPVFQSMAATAAEKFDEEKALMHLRKANSLKSDNVQIGRRLARFLLRTGRDEEAEEIVRGYLPSDRGDFVPADFELQLIPDVCKVNGTNASASLDDAKKITPWHLKRFFYTESIAEAITGLNKMNVWAMNEGLRELHKQVLDVLKVTNAVISAYPSEIRERVKLEIEEKIESRPNDCFMVFPAESDTTYVLFSGLAGEIGGLPLDKLHWHVRTLPANIIYIRDKAKNLHLGGTKGVSDDMEGLLLHLKNTLQSLGTKKLVTVGFSGGSFASMWSGVTIGAQNCKAYGPVTSLDMDFIKSEPDGPDNYLPHLERIGSLLPENMDLSSLVRSHPETAIDLYYGAECERDIYRAGPLLGIENVRHNLVQGADEHQITVRLLASGKFVDTLRENVEF